jgi:hypothetical protein
MGYSVRGFTVSCVMLFGLAGCGGSQPAQAPPETGGQAARSPAVAAYMKEHFTQVAVVRDAVIRDDPQAAQAAANWIVEHQEVQGLPGDWRPYVEHLTQAAQAALNATSVDQAGQAVGTMGRDCGECHMAVRAGLTAPPVGPTPTDMSTVPAHMKRHQWAIEQMWIGLVYPSEEAWRRGADGLAFAALRPEELARDQAADKAVGALAIKVHTLGGEGAAAEGLAARGDVYGRLIATCQECHRRVRLAAKTD